MVRKAITLHSGTTLGTTLNEVIQTLRLKISSVPRNLRIYVQWRVRLCHFLFLLLSFSSLFLKFKIHVITHGDIFSLDDTGCGA